MTTNTIRDEFVTFTLPDGRRAVGLLPTIPEDAPFRIREGIARRRITAMTGCCPCGATVDYDAARIGRYKVAEAAHAGSCPASTTKLVKACRRWLR